MSYKLHECPKCWNKVRTLYEWKGNDYCGMCQQENIEQYEATIVYRFFLLLSLSRSYMGHIFGQVVFPERGWIRRAVRVSVYEIQGAIAYVKGIQADYVTSRTRRRNRREEKRNCRRDIRNARRHQKWARKERRKADAQVRKEQRAWAKVHKAKG